jgi:hypothetical protein
MSKKLITLILVVLLFGLVGGAAAMDDIYWDDGDPCDHLWSSPNNWDPDGTPVLIDANTELGDAVHVESGFGLGNSPIIDGSVILADPNTGSKSLTVIVGAWVTGPEEAYLTMTGGELLTTWEVILGLSGGKASSRGTLNMTGGYIHTLDTVFVGAYGVGTVNMTDPCGTGGGTIDIDAILHIPGEIDWLKGIGSGHVNLDGGTINCGDISMGLGSGGTMDINEGVLNVQGDATVKVIGYVENGWITGRGSGDPRNVSVVYDDVNDVTVVTYDPEPDLTLPWKPRPLPGSEDIGWQPTLSWEAGIYADTHSVYFGSSMSDVNASATPVSVNQPGITYNPAGYLKFGTTYYWRIDEVNDACEPYVWAGPVWSFTVGDSVIVDNFDEYLNYSELMTVWDDYALNDSGAVIDLETDANFARAGKSMEFVYDNTEKKSGNYTGSWADADTVDFDVGSNWTAAEVKALALHFYGQSGNSTGANDKLQVVLEDTSSNVGVVTYPDTNALGEESWHEWNIELADFDACGVSLANVSRIHIGTDDWYNSAAGGGGTLYFDEIRVHPVRCVTEYGPGGDATGDCSVDYYDVNAVGTDWLLDDYNIVATSPASPVGQWLLDEGSGTTANDSVGSNHGTWGGSIAEPIWLTDPCGVHGTVVDFDGVGYFDIPSAAFADVNDELSITFWEYGTMTPSDTAHVMFHAHDACSPYDLTVKCELWHPAATGCDLFFDAGTGGEASADSVSGRAAADEYQGQWNHYAFTKNVGKGEMKIYLNGVLLAEGEETLDAPVKGSEISSFKIGSDADAARRYDGYLSDVRLYDYELSYGEVRYVAGEMDDLLIPLPHLEVDVYADGEIDFYDYAMVADDWLTEVLWPSP